MGYLDKAWKHATKQKIPGTNISAGTAGLALGTGGASLLFDNGLGTNYRHLTDDIGLTDHKGQKKKEQLAEQNRRDAKAAGDRAYEMASDEIKFQRDQYDDWKSIYGPLQEDIGTYFKNITGGKIATKQVQSIQREYQAAQTNIDAQLAQRGLSNSGLQAQTLVSNNIQAAQAKATARTNADSIAQQQKMGFLGLGLGQGTSMLGINAQASNTGVNSSIGAMSNYAGMSNANTAASTSLSLGNMQGGQFLFNQATDFIGGAYGFNAKG